MHAVSRTLLATAVAGSFALVGCAPAEAPPAGLEAVSIPVFANASDATHLTGDQERPVPVETDAVGQFVMKLSKDGQSIDYRLIASNIQNVTMSHIHRITTPGATTGGIVVWLYPSAPPAVLIPGRHSGILAEGTFTAANFVGSLAGQSMETFLAELAAGKLYANVHTVAHPPGEIRGDMD